MPQLSAIAQKRVKQLTGRTQTRARKRRKTASSLGLTGEDIAKLVTRGKTTSKDIERASKVKQFRQTFIRKSGTAESVLKPRTIRQIQSGNIRAKGGFSIIDGVLVPEGSVKRVQKILRIK